MKKLGVFLATVLVACALLITPALAHAEEGHGGWHGRDRGGYWGGEGHEWQENHPYRGYGSGPWGYPGYGAYPERRWNPGWGWHHDDDDGWYHRGGWFHRGDDD
jgi:hypothetical protein